MKIIRGLDPLPSDAELLRRAAERSARPSAAAPTPVALEVPLVALPFRLTVPWSLLVSDNAKYGVLKGRMILTPAYRQAKAEIRKRARAVAGEARPHAAPLVIDASVFLPDQRAHDVANFSKCVHDALETTVYELDRWLKDVRWHEAGIDVDAPRVELTIRPRL